MSMSHQKTAILCQCHIRKQRYYVNVTLENSDIMPMSHQKTAILCQCHIIKQRYYVNVTLVASCEIFSGVKIKGENLQIVNNTRISGVQDKSPPTKRSPNSEQYKLFIYWYLCTHFGLTSIVLLFIGYHYFLIPFCHGGFCQGAFVLFPSIRNII